MSRWSEAVDAQLEALYEKVPDVGCKGLCVDFCGPIGMGRRERQRIKDAGVRITPEQEAKRLLLQSDGQWSCDALVEGRCAVYDVRPMVCRIWGAAEGMECPYGCRPQGELLTRAEAFALLDAADKAGTVDPPRGKESFEKVLKSAAGKQAQSQIQKPTRDRKRSRRLRGQ